MIANISNKHLVAVLHVGLAGDQVAEVAELGRALLPRELGFGGEFLLSHDEGVRGDVLRHLGALVPMFSLDGALAVHFLEDVLNPILIVVRNLTLQATPH